MGYNKNSYGFVRSMQLNKKSSNGTAAVPCSRIPELWVPGGIQRSHRLPERQVTFLYVGR
jgi:hypothetical protein